MDLDYRLTKSAQNVAAELIQENGLNPAEFDRSEEEDVSRGQTFALTKFTHRPTGYWFLFYARYDGFGQIVLAARFSPPQDNGSNSIKADHRNEQLRQFEKWLAVVKREHEAPDLWAAFAEESRLITGEVVDESNEAFTPAERAVVRHGLDEIRNYLIEQTAPTPQQINFINVTINYLAESSDRMTKKDWKNQLVAGLIALTVALAANPGVMHGAFALAAKYILPVLGQLSLPLLP